jgi:hypothetical protein
MGPRVNPTDIIAKGKPADCGWPHDRTRFAA